MSVRNKAHVANQKYSERYSGMCERCQENDYDVVHHIKPVRTHPELATNEDNLMALCDNCHSIVDKYANNPNVEKTSKNLSISKDVADRLSDESFQSGFVEQLLREHYGMEVRE